MAFTEGNVYVTGPRKTSVLVELNAGSGISVTGPHSTPTISATGGTGLVTTIIPGPGISVSPDIATPTISNTGVLTVVAGTNITVTGTASNPVVNASGVVETITAGTGISIGGTATDPTVTNTGVITVTAGTNVTITGTATDPIISASGGGGGGSSLIYATVNVTAAALALGGEVVLKASTGTDQYQIVTAYTDASASTAFSGGGGDRDLLITDNTSEYGFLAISSVDVTTNGLTYVRAGQGIVIPTANNVTVPTVAGADIVAKYTGGTLDYLSGDVTITLVLQQVAGTPISLTGMVFARVVINQADLALGGEVVIQASTGTDQYVVMNAYTSAADSTDFSGGGGDRDLLITDGTSEYGTIEGAACLSTATASSLAYGVTSTTIRVPTANDVTTPTVAGADLVAKYTGGTTDYTAGALALSMVLMKIA